MKIWLPYTAANSGSSVFMHRLGAALNGKGIPAVVQEFPHNLQYIPHLLQHCRPPAGTTAVISNSWSGFAFHRQDIFSISVEHLFVLDPALSVYKSFAQTIFHEKILRHYLAQSYRSADHVVAVSAYTAHALNETFPDVEVTVIRNGVDTAFFSPEVDARGLDRNRPFRLGFAGNHSRRKGVDLLVPTMQRLGPNFELWHTGPEMLDVPDGLRPHFVAKGRLDALAMRDFYRQCDALLVPTRLEGLPLTVIEAQACGLPIITTNCTSLPEVVADGVTGFVCPVDDVGAMVKAAHSLAENVGLRRHMSEAARSRAMREFTFDYMVDAYVVLLETAPQRAPVASI